MLLVGLFAVIFGQAQIVDQCFTSVETAADFANSGDIVQATASKADRIQWNGTWSGLNGNITNNVDIIPPGECPDMRAIFFRVAGGSPNGEGVGFRLPNPLVAGTTFNVTLTYVSEGTGSTGLFTPRLYTHDSPEFLDGNGNIQAELAQVLPAAGTNWTEQGAGFNVTAAMNGHTWLFFHAPNNSGILLNLCQDNNQPLLFEGGDFEITACEGESVPIGTTLGPGNTAAWSTGSTSGTIDVTNSGFYSMSVSNVCESVSASYTVTFYGEPSLLPEVLEGDTLLICAGDSVEMTLEGLNPSALWPDGTLGESWYAAEEGDFTVSITDDCFTVLEDIKVDYDTIPEVDLGIDVSICEDQTYTWDVTHPNSLTEYLWYDGGIAPTHTTNVEGTISVTLTSPCGTATDAVYLEVSEEPEDFLVSEIELCTGRKAVLDVSDIEGTYEWSTGEETPVIETQFSGNIWVEIRDDDFCWTVRDTTRIIPIECTCPMFMPNAFTPDGDGINDTFSPVFECAPYNYSLQIYDRWGRVVYFQDDPEIPWNGYFDGNFAPPGIYNWRLNYSETFDGLLIRRFGTVTIIGRE